MMVVVIGVLLILLVAIFVVVAINDQKGHLAGIAADARKALTPPAQPAAPAPVSQPAPPPVRPPLLQPPPAAQPERRFRLAGADDGDRLAPKAVPTGNPGRWFSNDDYPAEARRRNEQGRVQVRVKIDPHGVPRACAIVTSSGSISLDNTTCDLVMRRSRFTPARGADGKAVWGSWSSAIRWQLTDEF
jgi:protein TonB